MHAYSVSLLATCIIIQDPTAPLPEYVVYGELIRNEADSCTYMTCVTEISSSWISVLCKCSPYLQWSSPLESPHPYYDAEIDEVMCYVVPRYGNDTLHRNASIMMVCIERKFELGTACCTTAFRELHRS